MNLGGAAEGGRGEVGGREAPVYVAGRKGCGREAPATVTAYAAFRTYKKH